MAGIQDILGQFLGGGSGGGSDITKLIEPLMNLIQQKGGLQQILGQLQNSPIGSQVSSWISTGENASVSPDQVAEAMPDTVNDLASQTGMSTEEVAGGLSQMLPNLVNGLTPGGSLPGADQVQEILANIPGADQIQGQLGNLLGGLLGGNK